MLTTVTHYEETHYALLNEIEMPSYRIYYRFRQTYRLTKKPSIDITYTISIHTISISKHINNTISISNISNNISSISIKSDYSKSISIISISTISSI